MFLAIIPNVLLYLHPGRQTVCVMYHERAFHCKGNHMKGGKFVIILENYYNKCGSGSYIIEFKFKD